MGATAVMRGQGLDTRSRRLRIRLRVLRVLLEKARDARVAIGWRSLTRGAGPGASLPPQGAANRGLRSMTALAGYFVRRLSVAAACAALLYDAAPSMMASAQGLEGLERVKSWSVYVHEHARGRTCFAATRPEIMHATTPPRVLVRAYVASHQANPAGQRSKRRPRSEPEVSLLLGLPLKTSEPVSVRIKDKTFALFADGETAFVEDRNLEKNLIKAMRRGRAMLVEAVAENGAITMDVFSLMGFAAALRQLQRACP